MKLIKKLGFKDFGTYRKSMGLYECPQCNKHFKARNADINSGKQTGCGCKHELHGDSKTKLYMTWEGMRARCRNKKHISYSRYGGRNIKVCNEWNNSFLLFKEWALTNGYYEESKNTLDRINNDGNYEPTNCRYIDGNTQMSNRAFRGKNLAGALGIYPYNNSKKYYSRICINKKSIIIIKNVSRKKAIIARNKYIDDNNLPHMKSYI